MSRTATATASRYLRLGSAAAAATVPHGLCACGNAATASYICRRHGYVCAAHRQNHLKEESLVPNYQNSRADERETLHAPTDRDGERCERHASLRRTEDKNAAN